MNRETQLRNSSRNLAEAILTDSDIVFTVACYIRAVLGLDKEAIKPMADILAQAMRKQQQ